MKNLIRNVTTLSFLLTAPAVLFLSSCDRQAITQPTSGEVGAYSNLLGKWKGSGSSHYGVYTYQSDNTISYQYFFEGTTPYSDYVIEVISFSKEQQRIIGKKKSSTEYYAIFFRDHTGVSVRFAKNSSPYASQSEAEKAAAPSFTGQGGFNDYTKQ
ncbi:MAG: hypothetical protein JNM63_18525 [Spirochaetia bacterium]|nr:hypothetical protein [Spirochaetia bacterium]